MDHEQVRIDLVVQSCWLSMKPDINSISILSQGTVQNHLLVPLSWAVGRFPNPHPPPILKQNKLKTNRERLWIKASRWSYI